MPDIRNLRINVYPGIRPATNHRRRDSVVLDIRQGDVLNAEITVPRANLHRFVRIMLETAGAAAVAADREWVPAEKSGRDAPSPRPDRPLDELLELLHLRSSGQPNIFHSRFRERGGTLVDGHSDTIGDDLSLYAELVTAGFARRENDFDRMGRPEDECLEDSERLAGAVEKIRLAARLVREAQDTIVDVFPT